MLDDTCLHKLMKAIMYSSFKVESSSTPVNEINSPKTPVMNEDVKLSSPAPFMLTIMTATVLENIHRLSITIDIYIDYLHKITDILTDQIILVRCYIISVFKILQESLKKVHYICI